MEQNRESNPKNIKILALLIVATIVIIFSILSLQRLFRNNPYGKEIKIDNFNEYYNEAPQTQRDITFNQLYEAVLDNGTPEDKIPKSGAIIRSNTAQLEHSNEGYSYYGSFIVDIPEIRQSYRIQITWTTSKNDNSTASDFPALVTCLKPDEIIYEDFICKDAFTEETAAEDNLIKEYPLATSLPIDIEYYVNGHGEYVHYTITNQFNESDDYTVLITDYTGGNYEPALERIRNLGFNPDDYEIEYKDLSEEYAAPGYAGD